MKHHILSLLFAGLLITTPNLVKAHGGDAHDEGAQKPWTAEQQAIADALDNFAQAMESGKLEEVEKTVMATEDFTFVEGTSIDRGWASYAEHLGPEIVLFKDTSYTISNVRPFVGESLGYASYNYQMDVTIVSEQFEGGSHPVSMEGTATAILAKAESGWKIQHMHMARKKQE